MSQSEPNPNTAVTSTTSKIWDRHVPVADIPGFRVRTAFPTNPEGVEVMLEQWEAGTGEPPHSHPGDDMTIVVEGKMSVQFYIRENGALVADGAPVILNKGDVGYIRGGRIHDAKYLQACKLVFVHDKGFAFIPQSP